MQKIAMENNLSETVFFLKEREKYHVRWFTPKAKVGPCGLVSTFGSGEKWEDYPITVIMSVNAPKIRLNIMVIYYKL